MVVSFDVTTMHGEAEGIALPDAQTTYRFLTARLNEGKRCSLVVLVPVDCSPTESVTHMNNAWDIIALCTKAKWLISFGVTHV